MPTTLEQLQYGFDRDSRRVWRNRATTQGWDNAYAYDSLSQVTGDDRGDLNLAQNAIAGIPANGARWDYDETGNWHGYQTLENGAALLNQSRTHDKGNRLMEVEGAAAMRTDRAGRMVQAVPGPQQDWSQSWQITWDAWSRITQVSHTEGNEIHRYAYDGITRRITRTNNQTGVTLRSYYNDQWRSVEERKNSETTASLSYLWGARHRDDLIRRDRAVEGTSLNETRYILMDYFSPSAITDAAGAVKERYQFSAFGLRTILNPNFTPRTSSECAMEFSFQGQFVDAETGWMDYGYRYYLPALGRWSCKDPIGERGGWNLYGVAGNSPLNQVDLLGLEAGIGAKLDDGSTPVTVPAPGVTGESGEAHFAARGRSLCDCNVAGEIIFTLTSHSNEGDGDIADPKNYRMGANGKLGEAGQRVPLPSTDPDQLDMDMVTQSESRPKCPSGPQTGTTTITLQHTFAPGGRKGIILKFEVEWKYECQKSGDKCEEIQALEYKVKNLQNSTNGNL